MLRKLINRLLGIERARREGFGLAVDAVKAAEQPNRDVYNHDFVIGSSHQRMRILEALEKAAKHV